MKNVWQGGLRGLFRGGVTIDLTGMDFALAHKKKAREVSPAA